MQHWSVPLLHGVLEHRSVFIMEVNDFPEPEILQSNARWTSQLSSASGQASICRNFWKRHENDLFEYVTTEASSDKLGKYLSELGRSSVVMCDMKKLLKKITDFSNTGLKNASEWSAKGSKLDTKEFLL